MSLLRSLSDGLRSLFRKEQVDQELDDELSGFLEMAAEEKIKEGMNRKDALRAVRLERGSLEVSKEIVRSASWESFVETFWQDVHCGLRMFRKNPGFTFTSVAALALAIGTATAVFSIINAVLLKPIHASEPDRVVEFINTNGQGSGPIAAEIEFNMWREETSVLQNVSAYRTGSLYLTGVDRPHKADALFVTEDYFRLFGLAIPQGRSFSAEEEKPHGRSVVVLSDKFWRNALGGDSQIIGKIIRFGEDPYEVIGVASKDAESETLEPGAAPVDVWMPFPIDSNSDNQTHSFRAVGRLKSGVSLSIANAQLQLMTEEFRQRYPNTVSAKRGDSYSVQPMRDVLVRQARLSLLTLGAAVSFVLLIACANVANLLLARTATRKREIAIRTAIGGTRWRIVRQLLTESFLLSIGAAVIGLGIGFAGIRTVLVLFAPKISRIAIDGSNVTIDWRILLFTILIALITTLLFGLAPAISASRTDLNSSLTKGGWPAGYGFRQNKTRAVLVISQISLALLLLIGSALLIRSLIALRSVHPGFDPHNVVTTRTPLDPKYVKSPGIEQTVRNIFQRLTAMPGVEAAGLTTLLPLDGTFNRLPVVVVGRPLSGPAHGFARWVIVSPSYFDVLRIPLLRGRLFTETDAFDKSGVAIINRAMARQLWPDGAPLNAQIFIGKGLGPKFDEPARRIVGIVADVHDDALEFTPQPAVFVPSAQISDPRWEGGMVAWVVRTKTQSPSLNTTIQDELRRATGGLPVPPLQSMETVISQSLLEQDMNTFLMTVFGCSALLLAAIGIYGLMAYSVRQRTRELGIRLALGAEPRALQKLIVVEGMWLALIGVTIGLAAAFGLTRFIASFLFGVKPWDPFVFAIIPGALGLVVFLSVMSPAIRASRVSPADALRYE
jgi:putative ABC transport system permease protein